MKEVLIATKNKHKIKELSTVLLPLGFNIKSLYDYPQLPDIIEDQKTFKGNALKKAKTLSQLTNRPVIADDSGLQVKALNDAPGIYSSRFASKHATDKQNNNLLLKKLKNISNREARFITSICLYIPTKEPIYFTGILNGRIATNYKGENGFGYDPIFIEEGSNKHLAELTLQEKTQISHRAKATQKLISYLKTL
ncbi:MAG: RdgB/HAM1 family non-canonical purine NTP pyrophosphatase [Candidatus Izimaplasma sp.]|nr:RdgB/HAM1 family non-canonical purine NTP pyrophosphatase [Candidatus Izimaplasma bacterium]